jgi:hypothetical protein
MGVRDIAALQSAIAYLTHHDGMHGVHPACELKPTEGPKAGLSFGRWI